MNLFREWTGRLHDVGLRDFYSGQDLTFQYPPGYLYVLALISKFTGAPSYLVLKLPAIVADLGLAWISGLFAVRIAPASLRKKRPVRALVIAAVLFNPAVIALRAIWGQVDSVPIFFIMASLLLLLTGKQSTRREIVAIVCFAIAFSMKPQSAFLFPAIGYVFFRRHLYHQRAQDLGRNVARLALVGASGLAVWVLSGIPFGLSRTGLLDFYKQASNSYKVSSVWAFNAWGFVGFWRGDVHGSPFKLLTFAGVPVFYVGTAAFLAATAYVIWRTARSTAATTKRASCSSRRR